MDVDLEYLYRCQKEIFLLTGIRNLLDWDEDTNMPGAGYRARSEHFRLIESLIDERLTSKSLAEAIARLKSRGLTKSETVVIRELSKEISKVEQFTPRKREQLARHLIIAQGAWKTARAKNNYMHFEEALRRMIILKKEQAGMLDSSVMPYDVLIREYEEGMNTERYAKLFSYLRPQLAALLKDIVSSRLYQNQKPLQMRVKAREQRQIIDDFVRRMGITTQKVNISTSEHPFTTMISRNDVRITTRFSDPSESFFAALHESGHALYQIYLPRRYYQTQVYREASCGLDEAMAMIWEYCIGRSRQLWQRNYMVFRHYLSEVVSAGEFYSRINMVRPSNIRVNADEVTYCLHIMLRFEIEKELFLGSLKFSEIREAWKRKSQELLGIVPKSDNEGALQDVHWSTGDFGYFPSYALGAIYSAQLFAQMQKDIAGIDKLISNQEFGQIIEWLRRHVYSKARERTAEQIVRNATGSGLRPEIYIDYLRQKYSRIYGFSL